METKAAMRPSPYFALIWVMPFLVMMMMMMGMMMTMVMTMVMPYLMALDSASEKAWRPR